WKRETAMAEDYLDRALRGDPGARDALVFKADLRFANGDITGAVMLLRAAKRLRRPSLPEVSDSEITDRLLRYEAALQPLRKARGGVPDMPGWVLCVIGVTLALTFMAGAGLPGAWNGIRHYQDGKARLVSLDYAGCASEMEQAVEAAPTSPKAWAYEAYCYLLDKDNKAGLPAPIQEALPLDLSASPAKPPVTPRSPQPRGELPPSLFEQLLTRLRAVPWARWRAQAAPVIRSGAEQFGTVARVAVTRGSTVARVAVTRGTPYALQLAKGTARISFIRAFPLLIARTIHLFGFPAVVLRTAMQFTVAHRAGLAIDEVVYFRVDDPAGYTVYEAPPKLGTAIAIACLPTLVLAILAVVCLAPALTPRAVLHMPITWVTWVQLWLGLSFASHMLPS